MNRLAQMPSHFYFLVCIAAGLGCSSAENDPLPFGTSGGANSSSLGGSSNSSSGGSTGSGLTGSGGVTIPIGTAGSNASGNGGVEKCVGTSSTAMPLPPVLAFLIDTSGSMSMAPPSAPMGSPSKWVSTRDALIQAFNDMTLGTGTGLVFYPNTQNGGIMPGGFGRGGAPGIGMGGGPGTGTGTGGATGTSTTCINKQVAVPLAPLDMTQRNAIVMALRNKMPSGNTPTHDAYQFALQTVKASTLPGSKYVVLVTDGAPTFSLGCVGNGMGEVDASPIVAEAANALKNDGIKTFVIGSPGSETARESLSKMATQGGTPLANCSDTGPNYCHFDMTTTTDLSASLNEAFKAITGQIASCNYNIPPVSGQNVLDLTQINVNYTTGSGMQSQVPRDASMTECNHGWQLSSDSKQIMLCPDMCDAVKQDSGAKVDVVFGCKTIAL